MSVNVTAAFPSQISQPPEHKAKEQHSVSLLPVQIHFAMFSNKLNQFHKNYYLKNLLLKSVLICTDKSKISMDECGLLTNKL